MTQASTAPSSSMASLLMIKDPLLVCFPVIKLEEKIFFLASQQLNQHPISATEIAKGNSRNPTFAKTLSFTIWGTLASPLPWWSSALIISSLARSSFPWSKAASWWGLQTIIWSGLRLPLLRILHEAHHYSIVCLTCSFVWLPGIDSDIENNMHGCQQCLKTREAYSAWPLLPTTLT